MIAGVASGLNSRERGDASVFFHFKLKKKQQQEKVIAGGRRL